MKLIFVVGPIGGGIAEVSSEQAYFLRGVTNPNTDIFPTEFDKNILVTWASVDGSHGGIEENRYMMENGLVHNYPTHKKIISDIIIKYKEADCIILCSTGLSLYIEQFVKEYPDALVYFVKRTDEEKPLEQIIIHSSNPEICDCGVYHVPASATYLDYIKNVNYSITESINQCSSVLGCEWSLVNKHYYLAPVLMAIYDPNALAIATSSKS